MTPAPHARVVDDLAALVAGRRLPPRAVPVAKAAIERLSSPVRIALLGAPGSGKSRIGNALIASPVMPRGLCLPSSEIRYDDTPGLDVLLGDGSRRTFRAHDFAAALALSPSFVEIRAPLPMLRQISLLEPVTDGSEAELLAAANWAAQRTDLAIWVSRDFPDREQDIWRRVPGTMKDHAFLALTRAKQPCPHGSGPSIPTGSVSAQAGFRAVFSIAGLRAADENSGHPASPGQSDVNCKGLIDALLRHVEIARRADLDGALLFLRRFGTAPGDADPPDAGATTRPTPAQPVAVPDAVASPGDGAETALALIRSNAEEMLAALADTTANPADLVIARCAATLDAVGEAVPYGDGLHDAVLQANDLIVLLSLEQGAQAALDAVIVLLQLKRDFEVSISA